MGKHQDRGWINHDANMERGIVLSNILMDVTTDADTRNARKLLALGSWNHVSVPFSVPSMT